jgi:DNA polymerase-3 subunit delta
LNTKPERLAQLLEKSLAPLYLVAGAEPLLVQESRDLILDAAKRNGFLERDVYHVSGSFDWDSVKQAAAEQSLFSSRSVIDLRLPAGKPGKDGGKFFSEWARQPNPDRLLIVSCEQWDSGSRKSRWAADLAAAGILVEIWQIKANELPAWIERRMRAAGLNPEREAVRLLAELVEGNLLAAQQEIDKLALLDPGASVNVHDIRQCVGNSTRFDAFRLSECLLSGRTDECLKVASGLRRTGVAIQAVTGALYYQLNQLDAVRSALESGENEARAFGRLRVFRMAQPLFRAALRRLSESQIGESFHALALIDRQSKGRAAGEPWQTLDRMLIRLCASSRRAAPAGFGSR